MRIFNDFEKELIKYASKNWYDSGSLKVSDLLEKVAKDLRIKISIDLDSKEISVETDEAVMVFMYINKVSITESEKIVEIRDKVIQFMSLLNYLEKHHLVHVYNEWSRMYNQVVLNPRCEFFHPVTKGQYFGDVLANDIIERLEYSVVATPELKEFVKNNFRDANQIKHEQNLALQETALGIAIMATVSSVVLSAIAIIVSIFT